ncbi:adenylate/guanylate cyclase domain-containing protein [Corynebacterium choanae]|uniref:Adenylate cyclase 2 n=1 Tax=Corynebacterium choanae TaxID=1862358 RepID=A0A3G6J9T1_9CORY|nr:adenylate/guanylate cyclase domain-containing protein [Corynebacterium choanae]AZA14542.1 Adenylate cyclase 2 [Corynebacterium choanae]
MTRLRTIAAWLMTTSWPLYAAMVVASNVVGAFATIVFIRVLLPVGQLSANPAPATPLTKHLPMIAVGYLLVAVIALLAATIWLLVPVWRWQRHPQAHDRNMVRHLVLRIPLYQAGIAALLWLMGFTLATILAAVGGDRQLAIVIAVVSLLATVVVTVLTYLEAQRLMRPFAVAALARRFEDSSLEPPIRQRLLLTWITTTGVPIVGVLLLITGQQTGFFAGSAADILPAIAALTTAALVTGVIATMLVMTSIVDPILELKGAIGKVRRGETNTMVDIYDGSEIGVLQAGFNEMMRGLRERQRVREIFGRYVGTEVARRALEERPTLGGESRRVAVLFVDVIGSTTFAMNHTPEEVVSALNEFFERVVAVVHRNKGIINKFQGDAALAVFGAPLPLADAAGYALAAARELRQEVRGMELSCGIGVCSGTVVAGHIGGHDRFEYTVIGDAVNQAARLTELAKDTPGRVLTNAATLQSANEAEQARWTVLKSVELRGRTALTQLARPIRPTLADRS